MADDSQGSSSEELKALYIRDADKGDWFLARQWCNFAGVGPIESDKCFRTDFTPEEQAMWVKLYEMAMHPSSARDWPKLRATLV